MAPSPPTIMIPTLLDAELARQYDIVQLLGRGVTGSMHLAGGRR
jgi:hypothetical protein